MQTNIEFLLESAPNLATAMQRITGQLQAVTAGRSFVIQSMIAMPELLPSGISELQPRMQITVVIAIAYVVSEFERVNEIESGKAAEDLPGMEDPTTLNENAFQGLQDVKAAAKRAGLG